MSTDREHRAEQAELDQRRIDAFVVRARRIAGHSLAADRDALHALSRMTITIRNDGGKTYVVQELPPEEVVESAAARVRPLLLAEEDCSMLNVLAALKSRTAGGPAGEAVKAWTTDVRAQWRSRTGVRSTVEHGFVSQVSTADGKAGELDDRELAMAWIYGDVVHHDRARREQADVFGLRERFRAAVPLVASIMVEAMNVLDGITKLHADGLLTVAPDSLEQRVVLESTTFEQVADVYMAEVGTEPPADIGKPFGEGWRRL